MPYSKISDTKIIGDSGTSGTYFSLADSNMLDDVQKHNTEDASISVTMPHGDIIHSTHIGMLPVYELSDTARRVWLFPKLQGCLLSFGQLCDDGCIVNLDKTTAQVWKNNKLILTGSRKGANQLWYMNLLLQNNKPLLLIPDIITVPVKQNSNYVYSCDCKTQVPVIISPPVMQANLSTHKLPDVVARDAERKHNYFHAIFGCTPILNFKNAIKKDYFSLPGVTVNSINKYLLQKEETDMGHMKRLRQGLNSSKSTIYYDFNEPINVTTPKINEKQKVIYMSIPSANRTHVDATGAMHFSNGTCNYDLIFFFEDANYIHAVNFDHLNDEDYTVAFQKGLDFMTTHHLSTEIFRMDAQHLSVHEKLATITKSKLELVPPNSHRALKAERAIQTWKNHKIAMLATADPDAPESIFKFINEQCEQTLNLLRPSGVSPNMSAWQQLHGRWNFIQNPMAPIGMKVQVFRSRAQRETTWSTHSLSGWYVGPAKNHKACYEIYVSSTRQIRISDTVNFYPTRNFLMPGSSPRDDVLLAFSNLTEAITNLTPLNTQPIAAIANSFVSHLNKFEELFINDEITNKNKISINDDDAPPGFQKLPPIPIVKQATIASQPRAHRNIAKPNYRKLNAGLSAYFADVINIAKIRSHRGKTNSSNKPLQMLLRFKNSKSKDDKWVPISHLINSDVLKEYLTDKPALSLFIQQIENAATPNITNKPTSFDDKFMYAFNAMISNTQIDTESNDHHGHKYLDDGKKALRYDKAMKGIKADKWQTAFSDELDRLFVRRNTCKFIRKNQLPKGRVVSYFNPQLTEKLKNNIVEERVRGTVGGNINDFTGNKTAYTASLPSVKILFNAVISDPDAKFMTIDLKDFFLHGSSGRNEYMRIPLKWLSVSDQAKFQISSYIDRDDKTVLVEINGNMYGLVNAALVSNQHVIKLLKKNGFTETNTPSIYKHTSRNIAFSLVVDDFGVKYTKREDAEYLIRVLEQEYECSVDWEGKLYLGMTIDIDRVTQVLSISMKGYIHRLLARFDLPYKYNVDNPLPYASPQYGQKVQYVDHDNSPFIDNKRKLIMQQGIGGLLYYSRAVAVDYTIGVNKMSMKQSNPTEKDWNDFLHLLNFAATWPDCTIAYKPSDMILILDGDVSYLSETLGRSRGAGVAFMGKRNDPTFINGPIDVLSVLLPTVVSSVCEGEYATAFMMAQLAMPLRVQLKDLGYKQDMFPNGSTLLTTDNLCAEGIANNSMKLKRSRAMDMRYHWLRDRVKLGDFTVKWRKNTHSLADFFSKILPTKEFQRMRNFFVVPGLRTTPYKPLSK